MQQEVKPSVQYGDLRGKVVCDGHLGPFLWDLAKKSEIPSGYCPISVSTYYGELDNIIVKIYACDESVYGKTYPDIIEKGKQDGKIEVREFDVDISLEELFAMIKRLDVHIKLREIVDIPIESVNE